MPTTTHTYTNWVLNEEAVQTATVSLMTITETYTDTSAITTSTGPAFVTLVLEAPLNCTNVALLLDLPLNPDPDIAGIGVFVTRKDIISRC